MRRSRLVLAAGALLALGLPASASAEAPHVATRGGQRVIVDEHGRQLLLRGVAVNGLIEYPSDYQEQVPVGPGDLREMAALGFDFLRLPVSWSRIEPQPGVFDQAYLDQVANVVRWAEDAGLHVLVDMHQDRYNRQLWPGEEVDGAPDWATETDGAPCIGPSGLSTLCAQVAFQHFWDDDVVAGKGLQEHFVDAILALSRRLRSDERLLGIELFNEPTPGLVFPPAFDHAELQPFYVKVIAALRADGERRMLWFEPNLLRDVTDVDSGVPARFSTDPDLVYAPHIYTEVFSPPQQPTPVARQHLEASIDAADAEAAAYGAPWVNDEWGGRPDSGISDMLDLLDSHRVGGAYWIWKQRPGFYGWQTVQVDGSLRSDSERAQILSRPHVGAVPGLLEQTSFDGTRLVASVSGHGGVARLWGGTVVLRGGPTILHAPLTAATVDGHPVAAGVTCPTFETAAVSLRGCRVDVHVPPGEHQLALAVG